MGLVKPKLDFSDPQRTLAANYRKILIGYRGETTPLLSSRLGKLNFQFSGQCYYPDLTTIVGSGVAHSSAVMQCYGSAFAKKCEIDRKNANANDFPVSGGNADSIPWIYTCYDYNILTDTPNTRYTRKTQTLGDIEGLDSSAWVFDGTVVKAEVRQPKNVDEFYSSLMQLADLSYINELNRTYAEYMIATGKMYKPETIPEQYPLPVGFVGNADGKTTAEVANEYLKLYAKALNNQQTIAYKAGAAVAGVNYKSPRVIAYTYRTHSSGYTMSQSGSDSDGWLDKVEQSSDNDGSTEDGSKWSTSKFKSAEYVPGGSPPFNRSISAEYYRSRNDNNEDGSWRESKTTRLGSYANIAEKLFMQLPLDIGDELSIAALTEKDKDASFYVDIRIQAVVEAEANNDSYLAYALNEEKTSTFSEQKRPTDDTGYHGVEQHVKCRCVHDQSYRVDILHLKQNLHLYHNMRYPTGDDTADMISKLGPFSPSNPFGYIEVGGLKDSFEALYSSLEPSVPASTSGAPTTVNYDSPDGIHSYTKGNDDYDFAVNGRVLIKTTATHYQTLDGVTFPVLNTFLASNEHSFDYSLEDK